MSSTNDCPSSSQPLLPTTHSNNPQPSPRPKYKTIYHTTRRRIQLFLSSRAQHYTVLSLVACDVLGIFADIIINLYQCDAGGPGKTSKGWDDARAGLGVAGSVFSCLFMLELVLSVWAFGVGYFSSKFHILDSLVILASFSTDVLLHGIVEEIASLVVILRLFRFFKIIEEFSVGAQEQMEGLQTQVEALERENGRLRLEVEGKGRGQGAADGTAGGEGLLV